MSRSDWLKFSKTVGLVSASFVLTLIVYFAGYRIGNVSGHYDSQADGAAAQYPSDTQRVIDGCFELTTQAAISECVSKAIEASHENQRAEQDLIAQREMSDWGWWALVVSSLQFFATLITLGFIKLTLDATLAAVKDTGDATLAMLDSNRIALESQRPWLSISVIPTGAKMHPLGMHMSANIFVKNVGQLVANDYHLAFRMELMRSDDFKKRLVTVLDSFSSIAVPSPKVVLPNDTDKFEAEFFINQEEIEWVDGGRLGQLCKPILIVSAFYRVSASSKKWERTNKAFGICSFGKDTLLDCLVRPSIFLGEKDLGTRQYTRATMIGDGYKDVPDFEAVG